jgi:hypothetical protein
LAGWCRYPKGAPGIDVSTCLGRIAGQARGEPARDEGSENPLITFAYTQSPLYYGYGLGATVRERCCRYDQYRNSAATTALCSEPWLIAHRVWRSITGEVGIRRASRRQQMQVALAVVT